MKYFRRFTKNDAFIGLALTLMTAFSSIAQAQDQACLNGCASMANSVRQQVYNSIMASAYSTCAEYRQYSGAEAGCLAGMQSSATSAAETAANSAMAGCSSQCSGGGGGGGGTCSIDPMLRPAFAKVTRDVFQPSMSLIHFDSAPSNS